MKRQGFVLWTVRSGRLDLIRAVLEGERANDESDRKKQNVKDGLRRRKERGAPVGPVVTGYRVEPQIVGGEVITTRVEDRVYSRILERAFEGIDEGSSPGEICRTFNDEGLRNRPRGGEPGQPFTARWLRDALRNRSYLGENGYPRMSWMTDGLFERVQTRLDERARGKFQSLGGAAPKESYLLRQLAAAPAVAHASTCAPHHARAAGTSAATCVCIPACAMRLRFAPM